MPTTISVLIPSYNAEAFICEALDSIASQSRRPDQIIVVDDGSTDYTSERVEQWSLKTEIKVDVFKQKNQGAAAARNAGIRATACQWIALLDADDLWLPEHLARLEQVIRMQPGLIAAFSDGVYFGANKEDSQPFTRGKALAVGIKHDGQDFYVLSEGLYESLLPGLYIIPSSLIFRRDAALLAGLFDEAIRYIEDRDFVLRLSRRGPFAFIDRVTSRNRTHDNNVMHPKNALRNQYYGLAVLHKMLCTASQLGLNDKEIRTTQLQLRRSTMEFLNTASRQGVGAYVKSIARVWRFAPVIRAISPKNIARAIYSSLCRLISNRLAVLGVWLSASSAVAYFLASEGIKNYIHWLTDLTRQFLIWK